MNRHAVPAENARLLRQATHASVATAVVLLLAKGAAWHATGSLSVLASVVDSLMDAAASGINLVAVAYSLRAADAEHKFGHGKAESLAGLAQAVFIGASALFLMAQAVRRLAAPQPLNDLGIGFAVMGFALLLTVLLLLFQHRVVSRTGSTAIRADSLHYRSDVLTTLATIAALFLTARGWPLADPLLALAIAAYILRSAWTIVREAAQHLMDRELADGIQRTICDIALAHPQVLGLHDLRTRQSGQIKIIQLHLDLDDQMPLITAHTVVKEVERRIAAAFPGSDIIIHQDPVSRCRTLPCDDPCPDRR
ncbi:MAG: cation diffusion facilitator family transporter [Thermodesulfobacteriota bacterium]